LTRRKLEFRPSPNRSSWVFTLTYIIIHTLKSLDVSKKWILTHHKVWTWTRKYQGLTIKDVNLAIIKCPVCSLVPALKCPYPMHALNASFVYIQLILVKDLGRSLIREMSVLLWGGNVVPKCPKDKPTKRHNVTTSSALRDPERSWSWEILDSWWFLWLYMALPLYQCAGRTCSTQPTTLGPSKCPSRPKWNRRDAVFFRKYPVCYPVRTEFITIYHHYIYIYIYIILYYIILYIYILLPWIQVAKADAFEA
jgi:hypothetical protein